MRHRGSLQTRRQGWTGPECPNATFRSPAKGMCSPFCLYRLDTDPSEHIDLAGPDTSTRLQASAVPLEAERGLAAGNCSSAQTGVCLQNSFPILLIVNHTCDPAKCCATCQNNTRCLAWNTNSHMNQCFLRESYVPGPNRPECTSGNLRAPAPPPLPPPPPPMPPAIASIADKLGSLMEEGRKTMFAPNRGKQDPQSCVAALTRWNGWWGPWIDLEALPVSEVNTHTRSV
jgi:hypothetical protein